MMVFVILEYRDWVIVYVLDMWARQASGRFERKVFFISLSWTVTPRYSNLDAMDMDLTMIV